MSFIPSTDTMPPAVNVQTGATMKNLLQFLEDIPGSDGAASGYSFVLVPAPDHLTVGGVIAINAHGTAVSTPPNDAFKTTYGSMSNRILSLTAVVTDPDSDTPGTYMLKTFKRGEKDLTALMAQLGRTMITDVTLQVIEKMTDEGLDGKVLGFPVYKQSRDIWGVSKKHVVLCKRHNTASYCKRLCCINE